MIALTEGPPYFALMTCISRGNSNAKGDIGPAFSQLLLHPPHLGRTRDYAKVSPSTTPNNRGRGGPEDDEPTEHPMWKETPPKGDENRCAKRFEARANIGLSRPTSPHSLMDTLKKEKGLHEKCHLFLLRSRQNVAKKTTK